MCCKILKNNMYSNDEKKRKIIEKKYSFMCIFSFNSSSKWWNESGEKNPGK